LTLAFLRSLGTTTLIQETGTGTGLSSTIVDDLSPGVTGNGYCPHQDIIALYHKHLPACPEIVKWTDSRAEHLRARWNETPEQHDIGWWEDLFKQIAKSRFLTGKITRKDTGRPFFASLDWIVKPENLAKILEGKYHE
jgi:hypothetical protein